MYRENLQYVTGRRIEIDSVQRAIGYQKLWAFIIKKLQERFPKRDYNRGIEIPHIAYPNIFIQLHELLNEKIKPELDPLIEEVQASLKGFKGIVDDVSDDEDAIQVYFNEEMNQSSSLIPYMSAMWVLVEELKKLKDE